jgi:hypothetical protein
LMRIESMSGDVTRCKSKRSQFQKGNSQSFFETTCFDSAIRFQTIHRVLQGKQMLKVK